MNAKSEGKSSRKRSLEDITIAPDKVDKRLAQALRAQAEIEWINGVLSAGDQGGRPLRFHDREPKEIVELLTKRRAELRKLLGPSDKQHEGVARYRRAIQAGGAAERPLILPGRELGRRVVPNIEWLLAILAQQQAQRCNTISIGQVSASDFRVYGWANPDVNGANGAYAYWPLSRWDLPNETYTGDWSGETGAHFWTWVDVPGQWGFDYLDSIAAAAVLEFTIPAPQCDAMLFWGTHAVAEAVTNWVVDADAGRLYSNWVLHESPDGTSFPASLTASYEFVNEGLYKGTSGAQDKRAFTSFDRSFAVRAGVSPKIHLGFSLQAMAKNGEASTVKYGVGDYFEFEYGVTYIMVSQQP